MFSGHEAFAQLAAIMLLEHGLPQAAVVRVMRQVRRPFEAAHAESLKKDPNKLFDQQAILERARPGMIATNNTDPVFLAFVRLTDSSVGDPKGDVAVCRGHDELGAFFRKHVTTQVAACGSRNPQVGDQAFWFCGESLEHIPALLFCR
jgi:hypothetical protein